MTTIEVQHDLITSSRHSIEHRFKISIENEDGISTINVYGKNNVYDLVRKLQECVMDN